MSTKYFALLTQLGADKLANAAALGTKIEITHMAVGDGGGSLPVPDTKQTKLINEKRRAAINTLSIDPKNTNQIIAEQVIPETEGGWWIREIGLYDKDGVLVAVGNCAETYKPQLQEGSGRTQTIRMILIVSSANAVTLKVDPSIVLATREYVDNSITKHANSRNHPDATLKEKGFVILNSAVDSNSETHAATPKAVKAAYDLANAANNNANTRLEKNKNGADVADKDAFNRNIGSARAFSGSINTGDGVWTTEEFIAWLKSQGAFNHPYWMYKGSWWYANNKRITDTGCGSIHLAGAVVEVMGIEGIMTVRVTTAPTSVDGCIPNAQFTYGNHGKDYQPSWRRDYNTANKPTSGEIGAYSKDETDAHVNAAHENANSRLEKNKNGADIPNKDEFVKNLGLTETKELAKNAVPKSEADSKYQQKGSFGFGGSGGTVIYKNNDEFFNWIRRSGASPEFFRNSADSDYTHTYGAGLLLKAGDTYASFSVNYATARVKVVAGNDAGTANSPIKELAFTDDSYTKSESDAKYQILGLTQIVSEYNVPWNANSGLYYSDFSTHSKLIVNFNIGVGSCPTLQLLANYRNGGLFYRSARDSYGFEENWAELLTVESANSRYIQDVRLGTEEHATLWRGYGYSDTPPYVITEVSNYNRDEFPDSVSRRPFQKLINGIWHNIGAL